MNYRQDTADAGAKLLNRDASLSKSPAAADKGNQRLRLEFLEGLRGLAALYVVLYHVSVQFPKAAAHVPLPVQWVLGLLQYGHYAVDVFIVLSGYCLMLPVARSRDGKLTGGTKAYLQRRARRILPPYYAALTFSLIGWATPIVISAVLHHLRHQPPYSLLAVLGWDAAWLKSVMLHLFLIHNWFSFSNASLNAPLWSVAAEWQIYFLFPALLLPLWRSGGALRMTLAAIVIGTAPHFLLDAAHNLDWTCPWYLGLFALGAAGATVAVAKNGSREGLLKNCPWGRITAGMIALLMVLSVINPPFLLNSENWWVSDIFVGLTTVAVLLHATDAVYSARTSVILRLLQAKWVLALGMFSYSLYLVHGIVVQEITYLCKENLHWTGPRALGLSFALDIPLSLLAAYVFYLIFERPFLPGHPRTERQAIAATLREPAI